MARFTETLTDYFDKQTKRQYDIHDSSEYSKFRGKIPVLVTIYHQSEISTTTDKGFGNVYNNIGNESPKRYNKVYNIPLFDIDKAAFELSDEETGIIGNSTTKATMIPDTIKPIPEDFITFNFQDHKYLYKITSVDMDNIKSNNYFEIGLKYNREYEDDIENQVIDTYRCIYDNIGTEQRSVIKCEDYFQLQKLDTIYRNIVQEYMRGFYNQMCSTFTLEYDGKYYYDSYLIEFIKRHQLFHFDYELNSYCFDHILIPPRDFGHLYNKSIFYAVENKKDEFITRCRPVRIVDLMTYFYRSGLPYYNLYLYDGYCEDLYTFDYTQGFIPDYKGKDPIYKIINKYINTKDVTNKECIDLANDILETFKSFACDLSVQQFIFVPIILFIIKNLMNNITINNLNDIDNEGGNFNV